MSKKDVDIHYKKVCEQYLELRQNLRDFEQEARNGMFPPEKLEEIKANIRPIMDNYERWSYMMFLLNQPNKGKKKIKYNNQNKKLINQLNQSNSIENIEKQCDEILQNAKPKKDV